MSWSTAWSTGYAQLCKYACRSTNRSTTVGAVLSFCGFQSTARSTARVMSSLFELGRPSGQPLAPLAIFISVSGRPSGQSTSGKLPEMIIFLFEYFCFIIKRIYFTLFGFNQCFNNLVYSLLFSTLFL